MSEAGRGKAGGNTGPRTAKLEDAVGNFQKGSGYPAYGGVAQLGEHLPCTQGVRSSILLISTTAGRPSREMWGENTATLNTDMGS